MATFGRIAGAEPSTVTFKAATISMTRNSSAMQQEIISLGDPDSSLAIAAVLNTAPASTAWALAVREVSYSTIVSVAALPANSSLVSLTQIAGGYLSTSAPASNSSGLNVWVVGGNGVSTTVSVAALPANSSLVSLTQIAGGYLSTAAPAANSSGLNVWVVGGNGVSTTVSVANSPTVVIGTNLQSTVAPSSGSSGLVVRPIIDNILTTASSNAFGASTSFTIQSSGAGIRNYVTAYSITCTNATATKLAFYSGSSMNWPIVLQAVSSAVSGANLAVSAPAYLFRTNAAEAFTLQMGGSSVAGFKVAVSYFRAP